MLSLLSIGELWISGFCDQLLTVAGLATRSWSCLAPAEPLGKNGRNASSPWWHWFSALKIRLVVSTAQQIFVLGIWSPVISSRIGLGPGCSTQVANWLFGGFGHIQHLPLVQALPTDLLGAPSLWDMACKSRKVELQNTSWVSKWFES